MDNKIGGKIQYKEDKLINDFKNINKINDKINNNIDNEIINLDFIKKEVLNRNHYYLYTDIFDEYEFSFKYFNNDYQKIYDYLFYFMKPGKDVKIIKDVFEIYNLKKFCFNICASFNDIGYFKKDIINQIYSYYDIIFNLCNLIINNQSFINYFGKVDNYEYKNFNNDNLRNLFEKIFFNFKKVVKIIFNNEVEEEDKNEDDNLYHDDFDKYKQLINNYIKPIYNLLVNSEYYDYYYLVYKSFNFDFSSFFGGEDLDEDEDEYEKILLNPKNKIIIFKYCYNLAVRIIINLINDNGFIDNFNFDDFPTDVIINDDFLLFDCFNDFFKFIISKYKK